MMHANTSDKKVPELRFPGFSGEWEEKRLGELFDERNERKGNQDLEMLSVSQSLGVVRQNTTIKKDSSSANKSNYKIVKVGDIAYNTMRMWQGASGLSELEGIVSPAYTVVRPTSGDSKFYSYLFKYPRTIFDFHRYSQGLTSDTWNLKYRHFSEVEVSVPSDKREQQKIASFLSSADGWIENLKKQKEGLKKYKKGMMQKIFSQEIRFKDEHGKDFPEWEERELADLLGYEQPNKYIVGDTEYDNGYKTPVLTAGKSFILGYTNETEGIFQSEIPVIIFDDFTTASKFVTFPFKVKSSAMKILHAKQGANIKFVFEAMQQIRYEIGGHGRHWISKYSKLKINTPSSKEQQKIAEFLTSLDNLIQSKQDEAAKAERWKKGLMQRMFV